MKDFDKNETFISRLKKTSTHDDNQSRRARTERVDAIPTYQWYVLDHICDPKNVRIDVIADDPIRVEHLRF